MTDEELAELEARVLRGDYQPRLALIAALRDARVGRSYDDAEYAKVCSERDELRAQCERMRAVVEAANKWRAHGFESTQALINAIDAYRAGGGR